MARKADPNKKTQIIDAATAVFARKGYAGTLMAQVAEEAGTGKGTIYEYFKSKDDLFFAVFEAFMTASGTQMAANVNNTSESVANRLNNLSDDLIQAWMAQLDMYALVMEFWSATATLTCRQRFQEAFRVGYAEFREQIRALIQEGVNKGEFGADIDPQKIGSALIGAWDALLMQAWLDADFNPLSASQEHMRIVLKGMAP